MSQKERKKIGQFHGGRCDIASVDFIEEVRKQDRENSRKIRSGNWNNRANAFSLDNTLIPLANPNELLLQIESERLDTIQHLLVEALQKQSMFQQVSPQEDEIAKSLTTREVFKAYKKTSKFHNRLNSLRKQRRQGVSVEEARKLFAGKVLEDIAYFYFRSRVANGILISPEITEELFLGLFKGECQVEHEYDSRTIEGVSVPDGMVVAVRDGMPLIRGYVEYSLSQNDEKYNMQFSSYQKSVEEIRYKSSQAICNNDDFIIDFVVPLPQWGRSYPNLSGTINSRFNFLPFDVVNFGSQVNDIFANEFKLSFTAQTRSRF